MWTKQNILDQTGKTIIVTGANVGLGYETALALYEAGAHVVLACRDSKNAQAALDSMLEKNGKGSLETGLLDLSDLSSVVAFADTFLKNHTRLDVLINNAGVAAPPASVTKEGYELQFATNFLGHFVLTAHLYPLLNATPGSRIVTVSSNGYQRAAMDFDNLKLEKPYDPLREYRQSKLANLIFSVALHRRITAAGGHVRSIATQPGANRTELTRHISPEEVAIGEARLGGFMDPWQGALPSLYAAVSPEANGGNLYEPDSDGGNRGYPAQGIINENALDKTVAQKLWELAEGVTGVQLPN